MDSICEDVAADVSALGMNKCLNVHTLTGYELRAIIIKFQPTRGDVIKYTSQKTAWIVK